MVSQLTNVGYRVSEIVSPRAPAVAVRRLARSANSRATTLSQAELNAQLVWFCVPDSEIARAAHSLTGRVSWKGKIAFHSSGALASDQLRELRELGASVAAVHPLMSFVRDATPSLKDVAFAVEGDAAAVKFARVVVRRLGGGFFRIPKSRKAAYHAFGAFTSPLLIALLATSEQVARAAGMSPATARRRMLPIVRQTISNYANLGPGEAFTGPIVRGDVATVRKHLQALKNVPEAGAVYEALARAALRYLPSQKRKNLRKLLSRRG